jgi:hypothetical protein
MVDYVPNRMIKFYKYRTVLPLCFSLTLTHCAFYNTTVNFIMFQVPKEAMRMFPPLSLHFREETNEIYLGLGHIIPAGTNVIMSDYTVHEDPRRFSFPENFEHNNLDPQMFSPKNSVG